MEIDSFCLYNLLGKIAQNSCRKKNHDDFFRPPANPLHLTEALEMESLRRRLEATEAAMERLVTQMLTTPPRLLVPLASVTMATVQVRTFARCNFFVFRCTSKINSVVVWPYCKTARTVMLSQA
uniref:Uncharacterized protein n=1 Tax=Cacopsylla melanoneura TaxID=428564 RepID=A0A8D8ZB89_9HEMI